MVNYKQEQELKLARLKTIIQAQNREMDYNEIILYSQEILFLPELCTKKRLSLWVSLGFINQNGNKYKWNSGNNV